MKYLLHSRPTHRRNSHLTRASLAALLALSSTEGFAQSASPVQSKARPFDLDIVAPVMAAGSDASSAAFQKSALPEITAYLNATLEERKGFNSSAFSLDPSKLLLRTESDVRVYFIGEGAGYQNTLGFNTGTYLDPDSQTKSKSSLSTPSKDSISDQGDKKTTDSKKDSDKSKEQEKEKEKEKNKEDNQGKDKDKDQDKDKDKDKDKETDQDKDQEVDSDSEGSDHGSLTPYAVGKDGRLIFPDASSPLSFYDPAATVSRSDSAPLLPGDFVDLGRFDAGTQLDFFLIANGAAGGTTTYSTQTSLNGDGIEHVVAFAYALKDSPYIILGFEDLYGGGDQDYNDVLFAVDVGRVNLTALTATPEPSTLMLLGCLLPFGCYIKRRMDARSANAP